MKNWYLISVEWENGEILTVWNHCTYENLLKNVARYMRYSNESMCVRVSMRVCSSEEEARNGSV